MPYAEGRIIRILERANESIVGRYARDDNGIVGVEGSTTPSDEDMIGRLDALAAQAGGNVSVEWNRFSRGFCFAASDHSEIDGTDNVQLQT